MDSDVMAGARSRCVDERMFSIRNYSHSVSVRIVYIQTQTNLYVYRIDLEEGVTEN